MWQGKATAALFEGRMDGTWLGSAEPWPIKRIYYHVLNAPCFCTDSAVRAAVRAAFAMWAPYCGITFQRRTDPKQAHIRVVWGIVLPSARRTSLPARKPFGWAQPVPAQEPDEIDHVDVFLNRLTPFSTKAALNEREISDDYRDVQTTVAHEVGHALGLIHEFSDESALMFFRVPRLKRTLAESDIAAARDRYGAG